MRLRGLFTCLAALALLALGASSASAASEFHAFSASFGEPGPGNGQLNLSRETYFTDIGSNIVGSGLAVNETTHDVYVGDTGNDRVDEFTSSGIFVRSFAALEPTFVAVDNSGGPSQGDVYVVEATLEAVSKFKADGTPVTSWGTSGQLTGFPHLGGLAVDPSGDLFVLYGSFLFEEDHVHEYDQAGTSITDFLAAGGSSPMGVAVDTEGSLFKSAGDVGPVIKLNATGEKLGEPDSLEDTAGVAVNSSSDDLYVLQSGEEGEGRPEQGGPGFVTHFAHNCGSLIESCSPLDSFGQGLLPRGSLTRGAGREINSFSTGLAIDASTGRVYVGDAAGQHILAFAPISGVALSVTKPGSGVGNVSSHTTPGIDCGSTCSAAFAETSTVTLTATPDERTTFAGWGAGDCKAEPTPNKCEVEMSAAKSVQADFTAITQQKLIVAKAGAGEGTVFGTSPGKEFTAISCGSTCEAEYNQGATIILTAQPEIGSRLKAWSGCKAEPSPSECEVEMSAAKSVESDFVPAAGHVFAADIAGSGATALSGPTEVAVDGSSHDIYVNDPGNYRVEKFTASGQFIFMVGKEVNATTGGNLCPVLPTDICQPGSPGSAPGQFENPAALAVDNSGGPSNGDLYVGDPGDHLVQKFRSEGKLDTTWGVAGQKDGSDIVTEGTHFEGIRGIDVNATGKLYVQAGSNGFIWIYGQEGHPERKADSQGAPGGHLGFRVNPAGFRAANSFFQFEEESGGANRFAIVENADSGDPERSFKTGLVTSVASTTGFAFDPVDGTLYQDVSSVEKPEAGLAVHGPGVESYSPSCEPHEGRCAPVESFGAGHLSGNVGVGVDGTNSTVYVANSETNDVAVFEDARPTVTTGPPSALSLTGATLAGTIDPESHGSDHGPITECFLEYGFTNAYGNVAPCEPDPETNPPSSDFTSATPVTATLSTLTPIAELPNGTSYHYRFVAANELGATGRGQDRVFRPTSPPRIEGLSSSHVTATSADLEAAVDPHGLLTKYTFEYGTTTKYGQSVSGEITGSLQELSEAHSVKAHIEGLQPGATYHFRVLAENPNDIGDPAVSEDQTFEFFPPSCPNSAVRQQTGAVYLPDCRAYELVSPANANATLYYPGGPNTGQSTSPSRFSYTGAFSATPGVNPINTSGDLYVATRTSTGWISHYIGLQGDQAGCMGGVPTDGRNVQADDPRRITNGVLTDPSMSEFLNYLDGSGIVCRQGRYIFEDQDLGLAVPSMAPFLWGADGTLEGRFPSGVSANPTALQALQCPYGPAPENMGHCTGETTASGDLSHLIFSSSALSFSEPGEPQGLIVAPGSAYEEDHATGKLSLISRLPADLGEGPIPQDPGFANTPKTGAGDATYQGGEEEFIRFPAVSEDGSHILMSTATESVPEQCGAFASSYPCFRYVEYPLHLYMRVQHNASGETYEIAENHATHEPAPVHFVGMTPDGSEVYFTSEEHLTQENEEHGGASLYLWSAAKAESGEDPLTLVSKGPSDVAGSPGDTANCNPPLAPLRGNPFVEREGVVPGEGGSYTGSVPPRRWTPSCGVVTYSGYRYSWLSGGLGGSGFEGRTGGTGFTPAGIANDGDIYFYSPERLDGVHGAPNQENLFLYRGGHLQYVTTLEPERKCGPHAQGDRDHCSDGPIVRMQTTPNDSEMAFITASQVTPYDNDGHLEMYTYAPSSGEIHCASCNPDGQPPTVDVYGSEDGLFLTNDGRAFFSTAESLVPRDTNEGEDVYEYVNGRPQLITPGTGTAELGATGITGSEGHTETDPGLVGVSANGTDVYFSTLDTLVPEDHNGNFLRFYDARTNGGFAQPTPPQPCAAAEECHGPGTEAPQLPSRGTTTSLAGGNASQAGNHEKRRHKRHHRRAAAKHRHAGHHRRPAK